VSDEYRIDPDRIDEEVVRAASVAKDLEHPPPPGMAWSLAWDRDGRRDPGYDQLVPHRHLRPREEADFEPFPLTEDPATFRDLAELADAYRALLGRDSRFAVRVPTAVAVVVLPSPSRAVEVASWYGLNWVRADLPDGDSVRGSGPFEFTGTPAAIAALLRGVAR
jgi:hypothetical protein